MLSINTNMGSIITANQLNSLNKISEKLSEQATTGKRINKSSDDAAGMTIAMGMRTNMIGNESAIKNIGRGSDLLSTQEGVNNPPLELKL